ncbi:MAG TPA: lysylphosphatidylglycerol synthase transmembrane domain-containing protein [Polyangiaceae bacterium]|nr:lysylphosphatidylglycerol synthase transmembrane domain-containing protein [Polyangiaceae bacterium]
MAKSKSRGLLAVRVASGTCALSLLAWTFRDVDFGRVSDSITSISGLGLALIALPALLALGFECVGWSRVFKSLGQSVAIRPLLRVRLMTEAVAQTLPLGVIWAESLKPMLLGRHAAMPASRAVAGLFARKYLLVGSQAAYVALSSALGFATLARLSLSLTGHELFAWSAFAASGVLCLTALALCGVLARGRAAERVLALLRRVPNRRWQRGLLGREASFANTDRLTEGYFERGFARTTMAPGLFFLCGWLCESLESFLILKLLGVELDFCAVASIEVCLSFLKNVLFVLPAGIGVQDVGYVSCLSALGVPDALTVGAAFSTLKRGKELFWAAVGYALLAADLRPAPAGRRALAAPAQNEVLTA